MSEKEKYFNKSIKVGAPKRCPILNKCKRRSNTIAQFNDLSPTVGKDWAELQKPYVQIVGEAPYSISGNNNWLFGGLCPEVSLFETTISICEFSGKPILKGQYDKYMTPNFTILETGHFTECSEYVSYLSSNFPSSEHSTVKEPLNKSFLASHWQFLIGTLLTIIGLIIAIL